jgi:Domain of unknown function (DUF5666)
MVRWHLIAVQKGEARMIDKRLTSLQVLLLSGILSLPFGSAMAATQAQSTQPTIVRGTISDVAGNKLKLTEGNGKTDDISLTNDARIAVVSSASLSDIKPDSYVGVAAKPKADGTLEAIEVHIFPASMRGTGEGTRAWDLGAGSSMTNGTVAKVDTVSGNKLTVSYRGGEKTISIGPSTKIVAMALGTRDQLKPGTKAFIPVSGKDSDGALQATRLTIGSGGMAPPM